MEKILEQSTQDCSSLNMATDGPVKWMYGIYIKS